MTEEKKYKLNKFYKNKSDINKINIFELLIDNH